MAKVASIPAKFDFRTQTIADLQQKMPNLFNAVRTVSRLSGVSFQYLIASIYVESGLDENSVNGAARGIAQIKPAAWKEAIADARFAPMWKKVAPGKAVPIGPGHSRVADIVALAVLTKRGDEKCSLEELGGDLKDKARRLCYHLSTNTAYPKIRQLRATGDVTFNDAANQKSWNRFGTVLDKAKLTENLAKAK